MGGRAKKKNRAKSESDNPVKKNLPNTMGGKRTHQNHYRNKKTTGGCHAQVNQRLSNSCIYHLLQQGNYGHRLSPSTPDFLTAILEYLMDSILELADNMARGDNKRHITPQHVDMAIYNHPDLSRLFKNVAITQVTTMPWPREK
ncbi:histone H2A-like [Echinops telfairi]|uniref:Histone H2A-like n=1 Tax=Echinops telfairi TaxID=9371 RepID=A0AC55CRK7_ECHTE|nr:histone H2A-like [Echinops telfairi]